MKPLAVSLLLVAALAGAQTPTRLYGKTRAKALAMGEQRWMDFVSEHPDGNSTQGMVRAMDFFATAAADRNDRLIAKLPRTRREAIRSARQAMREAGFALVATDRELAGGGTIYQLFFPSRASDVEVMVYGFLKGRQRSKPVDPARFEKTRAKWSLATKQTEAVEDKARLDESVGEANKKVDAALAAIRRLKAAERDACLVRLIEWLTPETEQVGTR